MRLNFKLRKGAKSNSILIDFRCGRAIRVRCSTTLSIRKGSEKYWNSKICRIKQPNDIYNADYINEKLREYEIEIEKKVNDLIVSNTLTQSNCNDIIKSTIKPKRIKPIGDEEISKSNNVLEYFNWYMEFYSKRISPHTKKTLTFGTIKTYNNCKSYFEKYLKSRGIINFYFEDFSKEFYYDFIKYGNEKGYTRNYIGSMIQKLKTIIYTAYEDGVHNNKEFKLKYFSKLTEEVNHPYLNIEELTKIQKIDLKNNFLNDVRDTFLIACNTGLRVGDLTAFLLNPTLTKLKNKDCIYLKQQKTGNEVYIPLNSNVLNILEKRGNSFPSYIHPNILNKELKRVLKRAKINENFERIRTVKGIKTSDIKPKYKFISMHSARRSFCTNAYNAGMPPHQIMVISGHKSEKVFYSYIKATVKEKALQVSEHSFFN